VLRYLARRLLLAVPTLFGVLAVTFLLLFVAPGDPVQEMVGERADAATIARLRRELRLDDPLPTQFAAYAGGVLRGDLGRSFITGRPIARDVAERFPKTLLLAGTAMLFASAAGIALGVVSARRPGGWADRLALGGAYLGISFPVYWVGLLLIVFFAVQLRWLPASGYAPGVRGLRYLVLPALALGTRSVAFLARVTRSAMLEVLGSDYVRTARAKGLAERPWCSATGSGTRSSRWSPCSGSTSGTT
jgi:ABC-type dipeptide/oligopeptide/nickel transport system permease component